MRIKVRAYPKSFTDYIEYTSQYHEEYTPEFIKKGREIVEDLYREDRHGYVTVEGLTFNIQEFCAFHLQLLNEDFTPYEEEV